MLTMCGFPCGRQDLWKVRHVVPAVPDYCDTGFEVVVVEVDGHAWDFSREEFAGILENER